jgi:hypothetical protein
MKNLMSLNYKFYKNFDAAGYISALGWVQTTLPPSVHCDYLSISDIEVDSLRIIFPWQNNCWIATLSALVFVSFFS